MKSDKIIDVMCDLSKIDELIKLHGENSFMGEQYNHRRIKLNNSININLEKMKSEKIKNWIKTYAESYGIETLVVGVSGGIDSALVSTLCAMTGVNTILIEMPIHQKSSEVTRSEKHIEWLKSKYNNVKNYKIDLSDNFDLLVNTLTDSLSGGELDLALVNTRSRLRMVTLHAFSNAYGGIVVGTGNKVEDFGIGFFTKYGDGGVDISPIGDLMKSEVYQMAGELGIINEILQARPTDGLWEDGRTDEDQIGATYDELEWAMKIQEEFGDYPDLEPGRMSDVFNIYIGRHYANKHKMDPIPIFKF